MYFWYLVSSLFLDAIGIKPANTRKLRRRPYDPAPAPEKRSKQSPDILCIQMMEANHEFVFSNLQYTLDKLCQNF